jgi:hypothetical protein
VPTRKVVLGPVVDDGSVSRLVESDEDPEVLVVESWGPFGWYPGGTDVASVLKGLSASPETLRKLGVPSLE